MTTDLQPTAGSQAAPEPIDDAAPAPVESNERASAPRQHDNEPRAKPEPIGENPIRDDIVSAFRQKRRIEEGLEAAPEDELPSEDSSRPDFQQARPQTGPSDFQEPGVDGDTELELVVYGERYKARKSELAKRYDIAGADDATIIRIAQKELAADRRLESSRNAPQPAQPEHHREPGAQTREAAPEPTRSSPAKTTLDDEKLEEIASRIQVGDTEEGKAALREIIEFAAAQSVRAEQVPELIDQAMTQRDHLQEINLAVAKFGEENADLVSKPELRTVVLDVSAQKMREAMAQIGVRQDVLDAMGNNRLAIADAYHGYRRQGYSLKPTGDLLTDVEGHIRSTFNMPRPSAAQASAPIASPPTPTVTAQQARERLQRKATAPQQPRHGGTRAEAPQSPRPKTPQEIVNEMRGQRHFR